MYNTNEGHAVLGWGEKHVVPDMWILAYNTHMYETKTKDMYVWV